MNAWLTVSLYTCACMSKCNELPERCGVRRCACLTSKLTEPP